MLTLLSKGVPTKFLKFFWLQIFLICHRCQRHRWSTLSCEYLREFSKNFETVLIGHSGAGGKLIHEKNQEQKISWHCPFKYNNLWNGSRDLKKPRMVSSRNMRLPWRRVHTCSTIEVKVPMLFLNGIWKVTYLEYHSVCPSLEFLGPPNPSPASECALPPRNQRGGGGYTALACVWRPVGTGGWYTCGVDSTE
jgi:hypothetical protein